MQDTGQGNSLPVGEGMLCFGNLTEAEAGVAAINADYERHRQAARMLAERYFDAEKVFPAFLEATLI